MTNEKITRQFFITVSAGKRLIARAAAGLEQVRKALADGVIVVVAGTTNGYIAEELLDLTGQKESFSKSAFFRGVTTAPGRSVKPSDAGSFSGDVVLDRGKWVKNKSIFDVAGELGPGDIIFKGANAVEPSRKQAGILIGNPTLGTSSAILQAAIGRGAELILPVGLEKRVFENIADIAAKINGAGGLRLLPVGGRIITELEAVELLTGAEAGLMAAGGVCGGEGGCWIAVTGTQEQTKAVAGLIQSVAAESPFNG